VDRTIAEENATCTLHRALTSAVNVSCRFAFPVLQISLSLQQPSRYSSTHGKLGAAVQQRRQSLLGMQLIAKALHLPCSVPRTVRIKRMGNWATCQVRTALHSQYTCMYRSLIGRE
jgi:hypothetical protein